jgi:hypothetical protein
VRLADGSAFLIPAATAAEVATAVDQPTPPAPPPAAAPPPPAPPAAVGGRPPIWVALAGLLTAVCAIAAVFLIRRRR